MSEQAKEETLEDDENGDEDFDWKKPPPGECFLFTMFPH